MATKASEISERNSAATAAHDGRDEKVYRTGLLRAQASIVGASAVELPGTHRAPGHEIGLGNELTSAVPSDALRGTERVPSRPVPQVVIDLVGERPHVHGGGQRVGAVRRRVDGGNGVELERERAPADGGVRRRGADAVGRLLDLVGESVGERVHERPQLRGAHADRAPLLHHVGLATRVLGHAGPGRGQRHDRCRHPDPPGTGRGSVLHASLRVHCEGRRATAACRKRPGKVVVTSGGRSRRGSG